MIQSIKLNVSSQTLTVKNTVTRSILCGRIVFWMWSAAILDFINREGAFKFGTFVPRQC